MFWDDLFAVARDHVAAAERSLVIAAPFVKVAALQSLLDATPPDIALTIYTRWRPEEVARGVSDTEILGLVEARGGEIWLLDTLHAKLFLVDDVRALVGSANVTAAGLGLSASPNFEILTPVTMDPGAAALLIEDLRKRSSRATASMASSIEAAAALIPPPSDQPDPDAQEVLGNTDEWVPRFRSPDRLFDLYMDQAWRASAKPSDPALSDLRSLRAPKGMSRAAFDVHVRRRLLESPAVLALDAALSVPQRFGALTDSLQAVAPELNHGERQALLQLLLRWMLYFAPDLYRLETPNYSEIVSKR